jgi:hypothetical protein
MIVVYAMLPHIHDRVGVIPSFLHEEDPRPARQQFDDRYRHGGGWNPVNGFEMKRNGHLRYPGDPPLQALAYIKLRKELIIVYEHAFVAIIQPDETFEVARMD